MSSPRIPTDVERSCRVCGRADVRTELDLGATAASCRYGVMTDDDATTLPFRLGACGRCGLIQLQDTPELESLRPLGECTLFRDPERHLDDLAAVIASALPRKDGLILGLTYKDAPLVDRMRRIGFSRTVVLDRVQDWGLTDPRHCVETMQRGLTPDWAATIRDRHGPADLVCVRHLLEHAHDVPAFLDGCRTLLSPQGWALFETPGCESEFARGDPGALWEEHVLYFTPTSLRQGLSRHAFSCRWVGDYPYEIEDCLVAFGQFVDDTHGSEQPSDSGRRLLREFDEARQRLRQRLQALADRERARNRTLAVWGAGHRTATFVQLLPATDLVALVIDDDPTKQGRVLPGTTIPIRSAEALSRDSIGCCVGTLNGDVWRRITARHRRFLDHGGRMISWAEFCA